MGQTISNLFQTIDSKKQIKLIMLGQCDAGKTTILELLKIGQIKVGTLMIGLCRETVQNKNIEIQSIDTNHNAPWIAIHKLCEEKDGLIFVIDSIDRYFLGETQKIFTQLMKYKELDHVPILLFLNKRDKGIVSVDEIVQLLELRQLQQQWKIFSSCALTGEGIYDGLEWILKAIKNTKNE